MLNQLLTCTRHTNSPPAQGETELGNRACVCEMRLGGGGEAGQARPCAGNHMEFPGITCRIFRGGWHADW